VTLTVSEAELAAFERTVTEALASGDARALEILGYGEVTTCLALPARAGRLACKRVTPFAERARAAACAALIRRYVAALRAAGLDVVESDVRLVPGAGGTTVLYVVQPSLPADALGPRHLRACGEAAALERLGCLLDLLRRAVGPRLAPDGQLSNWAFAGGRILYVDVSSPFMRDEAGRELLDWSHYVTGFPAPLRPCMLRWVLPRVLDKYYTLRGQVVDLLGNLRKERLERLIPPAIALANRQLALAPPVTAREVRAYYTGDARMYAVLQALRRADRWWHRRVLGRPYPHFLPPRLDRNL
jgi:hypothetical protein